MPSAPIRGGIGALVVDVTDVEILPLRATRPLRLMPHETETEVVGGAAHARMLAGEWRGVKAAQDR
ncbi:MAG: hypothetical protein M3Z10_08290 [Gemmatimonadota bacterium]|nr:hypothetical protein [Gemmatimonadota bacterium]